MDLVKLGYEVDSTQLRTGEAALDSFGQTGARVGTQVDKSMQQVRGGFNSLAAPIKQLTQGNGLRMVSMQMSQVASQGAVTGNYLQALAIQAPDLALGFGAVGIAVGALVPVLYGVAQGFIGTADEALTLEDAIDSASSAAQAAENVYRLAAGGVLELADAYNTTIEAARQLYEIELEVATSNQAAAMRDLITAAIETNEAFADLEFNTRTLETSLYGTELQQVQATNTFSNLSNETQIATYYLRDFMAVTEDSEATTEELRQATEDLILGLDRMDDASFDGLIAQLSAVLRGLADTADAADEAAGAIAGIPGVTLDAFGGPGRFIPRDSPSWEEQGARRNRRRGGGGGGGGIDQELARKQREAERVIRGLETATEEYNRQLMELNELQELGLLTTDQFQAAQERLTVEFREEKFAPLLSRIDSLSDGLANAALNSRSLGEVFRNTLKQMAADLLSSGIKQGLRSLFGFGGRRRGGGGFFGSLFAGFFDGGGDIPSGQFGIAGENGPEIVQGPAHITSTKDTAALMGGNNLDVRVGIDGSGNLTAFVQDQAGRVLASAGPQMAAQVQRRNFSSNFSEHQERR